MRMKILIISIYFPPTNSIASLRPYAWARCWSSLGHEVTVLTGDLGPPQPQDIVYSSENYHILRVGLPSFIQKLREKMRLKKTSISKQQKRPVGFQWKQRLLEMRERTGIFATARMPDLSDFWVGPAKKAAKALGPWDLVISTSGPYTSHLVAKHLRLIGIAKKWVADFRDLWVDNPVHPGIFPFSWIECQIEKKVLNDADLVTTVSEPLAEFLQKKTASKKVITIENGYDFSELKKLSPCRYFPEDSKYRIIYTGTIYREKQDPSPLFAALQKMQPTNLEVHFAGAPSAYLDRLIKDYDVASYVTYHGFISRKDALRMQRDGNALLFLPMAVPSIGVLTGKIFEYAASGKPILSIGGAEGDDADQFILEHHLGYVFRDDVDAIIKYLDKPLSFKGASADFSKRFDRETLSLKLLSAATDAEHGVGPRGFRADLSCD